MKRKLLHDDWLRVDAADLATLDVGAGTIRVAAQAGIPTRTYKLEAVYVQLVRAAYERGLAGRVSYQR